MDENDCIKWALSMVNGDEEKVYPYLYENLYRKCHPDDMSNTCGVQDFLHDLYIKQSWNKGEKLPIKEFGMGFGKLFKTVRIRPTLPEAVIPTKNMGSDIGYDLTLLKIDKKISNKITRYDTGIQVVPPRGYYIELVPRSSLSNTGYILANSVGIIDPTYTGNLKVVLIKVDDTLPDIVLPFRGVQMILRKSETYVCFDETAETQKNKSRFKRVWK